MLELAENYGAAIQQADESRLPYAVYTQVVVGKCVWGKMKNILLGRWRQRPGVWALSLCQSSLREQSWAGLRLFGLEGCSK